MNWLTDCTPNSQLFTCLVGGVCRDIAERPETGRFGDGWGWGTLNPAARFLLRETGSALRPAIGPKND